MAVSREALFEQVWAEPMLELPAPHGVSSSFLGRVGERLNVPRASGTAASRSSRRSSPSASRIRRARALLGGVNALERFAQWVPPEEADCQAVEEE